MNTTKLMMEMRISAAVWRSYYSREYGWSTMKSYHTARCRAIGEAIDNELTWYAMDSERRLVLVSRYNRLGERLRAVLASSESAGA